jgi:hypothetical protein
MRQDKSKQDAETFARIDEGLANLADVRRTLDGERFPGIAQAIGDAEANLRVRRNRIVAEGES